MNPDNKQLQSKIQRILMTTKGNVREMTAGEINRSLDRLDKAGSMLTDLFIAEGRGFELPSETLQLSDPMAILYRDLYDARSMLRNEISRRWGPGAPSRLPTGHRFR